MTINNEEIKSFTVYGKEQGDIKDFFSLKDCYEFIQNLKVTDKRERIQDEYFIQLNTDNSTYGFYKIYKRNGKYGLKYVREW